MMRAVVVGALALAPAAAQAFCGTYVGQPGAELYSGASQVVMVRERDRTVLTLTNDVQGSVAEFAMVIPVPKILDRDDVAVLDRELIERVQEYSGPRLVEYSCEDFRYDEYAYASNGCGCNADEAFNGAPQAAGDGDSLDVTIENSFAAGEYDIVVLSSENSKDLLTWLQQEGYGVSEAAETLLSEYIEAKSYFLAAKVRLDDVPVADGPEGRPYLSPMRLTYDTESFSLPIRLGTVNSPGSQDLILYTLTRTSDGSVAIANYPEVELPTDCMYEEARHGTLETFLDTQMEAAVTEAGGAAWAQTYSWWSGNCDPCPAGGALEESVVKELGYEGDASNVQLTRLWMRYTPEAATADLSLYTTEDASSQQTRFIVYKHELEDMFPICLEGTPENPGSCDDGDTDPQQSSLGAAGTLGFFGLLTGLGVALRRRRRRG